jgi:peptidoglycan hydrolase-like protein with peptidoglycan-binding domain
MKPNLLALIGLFLLAPSVRAQESPSTTGVPKVAASHSLQQSVSAAEVFDAQETLAKLGYGTVFTAILDNKTQEALRAYQRRNGLPVTGDLDAPTSECLFKDNLALDTRISFLLPNYLFDDSNWNMFVWAKGVWVEQGKESDTSPTAISGRIECVKDMGLCIAASTRTLSNTIDLIWFEVERWDRYEITSKPYDLPCGRETIRVNRQDKSVLEINTAAYKNVEPCTKLFGPPTKPVVTRLTDGDRMSEAQLKAFRAARDRLLVMPADAQLRLKRE